MPWLTVLVGLAVAEAGLWLLSGRTLAGPQWGAGRSGAITRSARSMFGFGVSYALASLTCTIAPFLAVVVSAFRADSLLAGSALFVLYAAGMGLVVGTAALAVAVAQQSLVRAARRLGRGVPVAGGTLLVLLGGYVAYYGWWETRVINGAPAEDPVIAAAASIQQWLANGASAIGATGFLLGSAGSILALVILTRARRYRGRGHGATPRSSTVDANRPSAATPRRNSYQSQSGTLTGSPHLV